VSPPHPQASVPPVLGGVHTRSVVPAVAKVSAVAAIATVVEVLSATETSNVSGIPAVVVVPTVAGFFLTFLNLCYFRQILHPFFWRPLMFYCYWLYCYCVLPAVAVVGFLPVAGAPAVASDLVVGVLLLL
jgi:hypothetical protein